MADFIGCARTNYFKVKDMDAFKAILSRIVSEEKIELFVNDTNPELVGFGCSAPIYGILPQGCECEEDADTNMDDLVAELQNVVSDDDAIIITEVEREKLNYVAGGAYIITSKGSRYCNIQNIAIQTAQEMLGHPMWETECNY